MADRRRCNPEIFAARRAREHVADAYVLSQLVQRTALRRADIPAELVAVKHAQLALARQLKSLKP